MDKLDKAIKVETFVNNMISNIKEVQLLLSFMRIEDEKQIKVYDEAFKILNDKLSKAKKSKSIKESKKYIKVKKVIKNYETGHNT